MPTASGIEFDWCSNSFGRCGVGGVTPELESDRHFETIEQIFRHPDLVGNQCFDCGWDVGIGNGHAFFNLFKAIRCDGFGDEVGVGVTISVGGGHVRPGVLPTASGIEFDWCSNSFGRCGVGGVTPELEGDRHFETIEQIFRHPDLVGNQCFDGGRDVGVSNRQAVLRVASLEVVRHWILYYKVGVKVSIIIVSWLGRPGIAPAWT